jgi:cytochrome P450
MIAHHFRIGRSDLQYDARSLPTSKSTLERYRYPSEETRTCPYAFYDALRTDAPVYELPGTGTFVVARYNEIKRVIMQPELFSSRRPWLRPTDPEVNAILAQGSWRHREALTANDPPEHTLFRRLAAGAFTPRRIAQLEERIGEFANELIDGLLARRRVEFVSEYAEGLPLNVIADILGISTEERDLIMHWSHDFLAMTAGGNSVERQRECARSLVDFQRHLLDEIELRRREPRDDFLSDLIAARHDGEGMPEWALIDTARNLILGGHETTTQLLSNMLLLLLKNPDQLAKVAEDRSLAANAVDEALRAESPAQRINRTAARDTSLAGVEIPAGSRILLLLGSANRDDQAFDEPEQFDVTRPRASSHLALGHGIHYCLGSSLARAEARITLELLLERTSSIALAPGNDFRYRENPIVRGLERLWIEIEG